MDENSYQAVAILQHPSAIPIKLADLESADPELLASKTTRSRVEYYWTCGPAFISYVFDQYPDITLLTYIDSDLYFFSAPDPIFEELEESSIGIIEHRFPLRHSDRNRFGIYNVGWLTFRRDHDGQQCVRWWRERCIDWCFDYVDGGRFGDQKYLDDWPVRFNRVRVIRHKGANLAPWNLANYSVTERGANFMVDDDALIFFHFHGLKQLSGFVYDTNLGRFGCKPSKLVRQKIFGAYIHQLRVVGNTAGLRTLRREDSTIVVRGLHWLFRASLGIVFRSYLVVVGDRVL
jgi:hypothetical protein